MNTPEDLTADELDSIERDTRQRCADLNRAAVHGNAPRISDRQTEQAVDLAVALYEAAAHKGFDRGSMDAATSLISAAIDAVRLQGPGRNSVRK